MQREHGNSQVHLAQTKVPGQHAVRVELPPAVSSASHMAVHDVHTPLLNTIEGDGVIVLVISMLGQSKTSALEAAVKCLAESLHDASMSASPAATTLCKESGSGSCSALQPIPEGAMSGGEAGSKRKALQEDPASAGYCRATAHDVLSLIHI